MRFENDSSRSFNSRAPTNHFGGFSRSSICLQRSRTLGDRVGMHRDRKNLDTNARYFRSLRDRVGDLEPCFCRKDDSSPLSK